MLQKRKKMNKIKLAFGTFLILGIMVSCEKNEDSVSAPQNEMTISKITDITTKNNITKHSQDFPISFQSNPMERLEGIEFNYDSMHLVSRKGFQNTAIVVDNVGYDVNKPVNYGLTFFQDYENNNEIMLTLIIKTEKVNLLLNRITYFDEEGNKLLVAEINPITKLSKVVFSTPYLRERQRCTAQQTLDCLEDVYRNQGWVSVWAGVQSAFLPVTAAALAFACAYSC